MNTNEETNKQKEFKAEINIEAAGKEEPTKYDIRRKRWAIAGCISLLVFIVSLIYGILTETDIYTGGVIAISLVALIVCLCKANEIYSDEPTARHFTDVLIMPNNNSDSNNTL